MRPIVRAMTGTAAGGNGLIIGGFFDEVGAGVPALSIARLACEGCYADSAGSGELDFFAFLCFQARFAAGEPQADCDGSGMLDFSEFLCLRNALRRGEGEGRGREERGEREK